MTLYNLTLETILRCTRSRTAITILGLTFLFLALSLVLAELLFGIKERFAEDLFLFGILLAHVLLGAVCGASLLYSKLLDREFSDYYFLLPLPRWKIVLGQWLGASLFLAILGLTFFLFRAFVSEFWFQQNSNLQIMMFETLFYFIISLLMMSMAYLFSCFLGPLISIALALGLWVAGAATPINPIFSRIWNLRVLDPSFIDFTNHSNDLIYRFTYGLGLTIVFLSITCTKINRISHL